MLALRSAHLLFDFAAEHRLLLHRFNPLGAQHISSLDFLVAIPADESDFDQGLAFRIPLIAVSQPYLLALRAPSIGMRIPRIIGKEKTLARPVQQMIAKVRFSPISVSRAVDGFGLVSSRFAYLQVCPSLY